MRTVQRRRGQQKQWLLDSELGFPPEDQPGQAHAWEPGTWSRQAISQGRGCADRCPEPAESLEARASLWSPSLHTPPSSLCGLD